MKKPFKQLLLTNLLLSSLLITACGGATESDDSDEKESSITLESINTASYDSDSSLTTLNTNEEDSDHDDTSDNSTSLTSSTTVTANLMSVTENNSLPIQARLLAAQCAQCHGTFGISLTNIDSIIGEADELIEEMAEYRTKTTHIMYPHALAYTDQELTWMSQYFLGLSGTAITSGDNDHD